VAVPVPVTVVVAKVVSVVVLMVMVVVMVLPKSRIICSEVVMVVVIKPAAEKCGPMKLPEVCRW
jgi:hypothetical protein